MSGAIERFAAGEDMGPCWSAHVPAMRATCPASLSPVVHRVDEVTCTKRLPDRILGLLDQDRASLERNGTGSARSADVPRRPLVRSLTVVAAKRHRGPVVAFSRNWTASVSGRSA
jgi:hypothetical protein